MPARKGRKPAVTEVDSQTKEEIAPSKRRAVSEENEEVAEVEKESEVLSEDEASKPKRGRGRPKKAVSDAPKVSKGLRGRLAKQKQENQEEKEDNEEKSLKQKKGRPRKNAKQEDSSDVRETAKSKANGKEQVQLTVEH